LSKVVFFLLDPVAEFCAAYAYMELFGFDIERWRTFQAQLNQVGSSASGFRGALNLVVQLGADKGLCSTEAATLVKWLN
jgi:hypothetical protein